MANGSNGGLDFFHVQDAQFNIVTQIFPSTGNVYYRFLYDAYGMPTMLSADWCSTYTVSAPVLAGGMVFDRNVGLYFDRASVWDGDIGDLPAERGRRLDPEERKRLKKKFKEINEDSPRSRGKRYPDGKPGGGPRRNGFDEELDCCQCIKQVYCEFCWEEGLGMISPKKKRCETYTCNEDKNNPLSVKLSGSLKRWFVYVELLDDAKCLDCFFQIDQWAPTGAYQRRKNTCGAKTRESPNGYDPKTPSDPNSRPRGAVGR